MWTSHFCQKTYLVLRHALQIQTGVNSRDQSLHLTLQNSSWGSPFVTGTNPMDLSPYGCWPLGSRFDWVRPHYALGWLRDRSFFMREGGLVGFGKHHLKIAWPPLSLPIFFTWPPLIAVIFWDDPPPKKKLNKQYLDFNFFNISLLSPHFTLLCSLWRQ